MFDKTYILITLHTRNNYGRYIRNIKNKNKILIDIKKGDNNLSSLIDSSARTNLSSKKNISKAKIICQKMIINFLNILFSKKLYFLC